MATRFYFSLAVPDPAITPSYSAEWEKTSDAARRGFATTKQGAALGTATSSENVSASPYDVLIRQVISPPLKSQTITGTVKGQVRLSESNADADFCVALDIKVVSSDGGTVRGTLLSYFPSSLTSEFATALTNRYAPPSTAVTSVECQEGDRIVVELGYRSFNTHTTSRTGSVRSGDNSANDLPEDESSTSDYAPWIEFSQTLLIQDGIWLADAGVEVLYLASGTDKIAVADAYLEVLYSDEEPGPATHRQFPVPPANRLLQSQEGKRQFPIVI